MISDVSKAMLDITDKEKFCVDFPKIFQDLTGDDANFEMIAGATLQRLRLFY